jgi:lysyl-tRNA synthetase class 2
MPAPLPQRAPRSKNPLPRIRRRPVRSSSVREAGYDADTQTLDLRFTSGSVYRYDAVPQPLYDALLQAQSAGRFVNDQIRGRFRCHRMG